MPQLLDILTLKSPELKECRFGRTMILYRAEPHRVLESLR
jgi:hypothetical protein